jgi:hypothetical protein
MLTFGIPPLSEFILLVVTCPEDVMSNTVRGNQRCSAQCAEDNGTERHIASLQAVYEWHPGKITQIQHVAEAVGRYVHLCKDGRLQNRKSSFMMYGEKSIGSQTPASR